MYNIELYHHGILGQRWGIRRYQNRDGTLTNAGKRRYKEIVNNYKKSMLYEDRTDYKQLKLDRSGITRGNDDLIKSGSTINRWADAGETLDHNRKYASLTYDDMQRYSELAMEGMINVKDRLNTKLYVYESAKDLKVASEKDVVDYVFSKYGDKRLRDFYDEHNDLSLSYEMQNEFGERKYFADLSKRDVKLIEAAQKMSFNDDYKAMGSFLQKTFADNKTMNEISEHYKKLGYDAIVDIEDSGFADYPIILLDPQNSVKLTSVG